MSEPLLQPSEIVPYPGATTRWDYFRTKQVNEELRTKGHDAVGAAALVTQFIFDTHPDVLDLPPAVLHRFKEAQKVMSGYEGGDEQLQTNILQHFQNAEHGLMNGYATAAAVVISSDPARPRPVFENGKHVQRIALPEDVRRKALAWNHWVQEGIQAGGMERIFGGHPEWVAIKLGEASWVQTGNLMVEAAEGLGRIQSPAHDRHELLERWNLGGNDRFIIDPSDWFLMTHIMDKELIQLAHQVGGESMTEGTHLTPGVYARSYVPILGIMAANPNLGIRGVLSDGTWAYSSELPRLFPDQPISSLHALAGDVVDIGTAAELNKPAQTAFATHDPTRKAAYEQGQYQVTIAARFIDAAGMQAVVDQYGNQP